MNLITIYTHAVMNGTISDDPKQRQILQHFERLYDNLVAAETGFWAKFMAKLGRRRKLQGIYLFGTVGAGKTYLMDLFFDALYDVPKIRLHFHLFMQQIDQQLRLLQGKRDPLRQVAEQLAASTRVLCLDEFLVHDVAHAMILAELLQALVARGVVVVTTANIPPDDLYLNGVHRDRFLPVIALLKTHCEVLCLKEDIDYRQTNQHVPTNYFYPLSSMAEHALAEEFHRIAGDGKPEKELLIQKRFIQVIEYSAHAVWFAFNRICALPRSQLDYLEIAQRFDVVCISQIPKLREDDTVAVLLLIHLVDVMYDSGVRLLLSAACSPAELYVTGPFLTSFQRTVSRLTEMQSSAYQTRHAYRVSQGFNV